MLQPLNMPPNIPSVACDRAGLLNGCRLQPLQQTYLRNESDGQVGSVVGTLVLNGLPLV